MTEQLEDQMPFARAAALSLAFVITFALSAGSLGKHGSLQNPTVAPGGTKSSVQGSPSTLSSVSSNLPGAPSPSRSSVWVGLLPDLETVKAWGPVIVGLAAIFLSSIFNFLQSRQSRAQLAVEREKVAMEREKQELADVVAKLNSFYGPFKQLRSQSRQFYRYFALSEKKKAQNSGKEFRTLIWLAEGNPLSKADEALLDEILTASDLLLKLIENQTGVVDKPALQDLLGEYAAHIRLLKLSKSGRLPVLGSAFLNIVYPRAIDGAIESAVLRLQDRLRELTTAPSKSGPLRTEALSPSVEYYNRNADTYASATSLLDLQDLYKAFLKDLSAGDRILDAGCGSGRDTRAFIERGYRVVSVDASREMVRKCREYPHAYCIQADLRELTFKEEFDGVWACAVLLHLTPIDARRAAQKLVTALKPGRYLFVSVKQGKGSIMEPDGRFFQYYDEKSVRGLLAEDSRVDSNVTIWISPGVKGTSAGQIWINALFKRVPEPRA